jgi:hypothetical protein
MEVNVLKKNTTLRKSAAALALLLPLAACGGDDSSPTRGTTTPTYVSMQGLWSGTWLTQYNRTRDNYNGDYSCPGQLTINHDPSRASFTGFAVVSEPCPPLSFDLTGSIDASKGVRVQMAGPRPGSGTCPQFPVSTYTGSLVGNTLSLRANATVNCPGEFEGEYTFNIILTAYKSAS